MRQNESSPFLRQANSAYGLLGKEKVACVGTEFSGTFGIVRTILHKHFDIIDTRVYDKLQDVRIHELSSILEQTYEDTGIYPVLHAEKLDYGYEFTILTLKEDE